MTRPAEETRAADWRTARRARAAAERSRRSGLTGSAAAAGAVRAAWAPVLSARLEAQLPPELDPCDL